MVMPERGLIKENEWKFSLKDNPVDLFLRIRDGLNIEIKGLTEKFNHNSRYFGYHKESDSDVLYIYIRRKRLRIDLKIGREN
jgi:hypothetical protein